MLEYENQILLDILNEDGLIISAKGLGIETVILNLIKVYSDPGNLVIVVGTTNKEEEFYISQLKSQGVNPLPKVITTEYNAAEREQIYLDGGVLFVSSRILVVDLLKQRVPIQYVTGFLVCRAHKVLEYCQEAFAIRLYRHKNKTGFVKAFSTSPEAFTVGFAQLEHIMKSLFVKSLYLWPRFHAIVQSSLVKVKPQVIELHITLTPAMQDIQSAVLDLMNFAVKEIKRINPSLDTDEITVENAVTKSFHKILQLQLDPLWHQLSSSTKQLVADLKTLRLVLMYLTRYDCVTFNALVSSLQTPECAMKSSGWQLLDAAHKLFALSKKRVFGKSVKDDQTGVEPEVNPKWEVLSQILQEINILAQDLIKSDPTFNNKVLILVEDPKTCNQVKQYLTIGAKEMLNQLYEKTFRSSGRPNVPEKVIEPRSEPSTSAENIVTSGGSNEPEEVIEYKDSYILSQKVEAEITTNAVDVEQCDNDNTKCEDTEVTDKENDRLKAVNEDVAGSSQQTSVAATSIVKAEASYQEYQEANLNEAQQIILLQTFKKHGDPLAVHKTLCEEEPRFVVMYDSEPAVIRRLEVYQSNNPTIKLHVYFMVYGGSVEEQAFLTALRREKDSFDFLIKEKANMVVPEAQDGKSEDCAELSRDQSRPNLTVAPISSRKGGHENPTKKKTPTIIVDMREFRSDLPSLIHRRGIEVEPVTLQVGDYILTPELCVERKSVNDLIGSLNSGRLYNQARAMTRHYSKPMLLIEFDQKKPFALQGCYYVSSDVTSNDLVAKLQLLTLHFPKLRLVWSPSAYATAQLFEELKQGRDEPDAQTAANIGLDQSQTEFLEKWNAAIHDFVTKLPGVTTKNERSLLLRGRSLDHLLTLSVDQISQMVNNRNEAQALYDGLHKVYHPQEDRSSGYKGHGKGHRKKHAPTKKRKL